MVSPARLGVYGGAFDPPHLAHLAIARAALEQLRLDRLLIIPTGQPWHRDTPVSPAHHRLAMARLAFDGLPGVQVDERETLRPGATYTYDTLTELRQQNPGAQLYLIIGEDQWHALHRWHRASDIPALATLCVVTRAQPGREAAPLALPDTARRIELPPMPHSATQIRQRVAAGLGTDHLVATAVARYIAQHQLYRST